VAGLPVKAYRDPGTTMPESIKRGKVKTLYTVINEFQRSGPEFCLLWDDTGNVTEAPLRASQSLNKTLTK